MKKHGIAPALFLAALPLAGCATDLAPQPVLPVETGVETGPESDLSIKSAAARPLEAGLLALSPDGAFALASDDVGTAVHVITLAAEGLTTKKVALAPGDEPGRAALTSTHAYVTLPRSGGLAVVELATGAITDRLDVCPSPQGAAVDGESLHVSCRGGDLITLSLEDGHVERALSLDDDLRDVLVVPSGVVVSRFATAELLWLDAEGTLIERTRPPVAAGEAAVAWRTLLASDGRVLVAHQSDSDQDLSGGYSGGDCGSITQPTVTGFAPPGVALPGFPDPEDSSPASARKVSEMTMFAGGGMFDLTVQGGQLIVIFPGNEFRRRFQAKSPAVDPSLVPTDNTPPIHRFTVGETDIGCQFGSENPEDDAAVPIAITTAAAGPLSGQSLVLTHSPATVRVLDSTLQVRLHEEDRTNSGLELFQMTVGSGISCASCHPGGRADARTWNLARGPRRTQPLEGGVSHRGAFHWDAEFTSFSDLLDDVMTGRMGLGQVLSSGNKTALLSFLDAIPNAPGPSTGPASTVDAEAAARGRTLFESEATECATCHSGPSFSNNGAFDVGTGGTFVTPSLVGVGYREPLMHDGCATDLADRFGPCGGGDEHGKVSQLTDPEIADLVAYMQTL